MKVYYSLYIVRGRAKECIAHPFALGSLKYKAQGGKPYLHPPTSQTLPFTPLRLLFTPFASLAASARLTTLRRATSCSLRSPPPPASLRCAVLRPARFASGYGCQPLNYSKKNREKIPSHFFPAQTQAQQRTGGTFRHTQPAHNLLTTYSQLFAYFSKSYIFYGHIFARIS